MLQSRSMLRLSSELRSSRQASFRTDSEKVGERQGFLVTKLGRLTKVLSLLYVPSALTPQSVVIAMNSRHSISPNTPKYMY
jgi:hypothetical protein